MNAFDAVEFAPVQTLRRETYRLILAFKWLHFDCTKCRFAAAAEYRNLRTELGHDRARQFLVQCANHR